MAPWSETTWSDPGLSPTTQGAGSHYPLHGPPPWEALISFGRPSPPGWGLHRPTDTSAPSCQPLHNAPHPGHWPAAPRAHLARRPGRGANRCRRHPPNDFIWPAPRRPITSWRMEIIASAALWTLRPFPHYALPLTWCPLSDPSWHNQGPPDHPLPRSPARRPPGWAGWRHLAAPGHRRWGGLVNLATPWRTLEVGPTRDLLHQPSFFALSFHVQRGVRRRRLVLKTGQFNTK